MNSVRRQLLVWLLGGVLLAGTAAAVAVYSQARNEVNELFDYQLRQLALSVLDRSYDGLEVGPGQLALEFDFVIQVWSRNGVRLYMSHPYTSLPGFARIGYDTVTTRDGQWRVYSVQRRGFLIQVGQPLAVRGRIATASALRSLVPFLLLVPVLGAFIWFTVGRALRPLAAVTTAVAARTASALQPIRTVGLPEEILPLVAALNDLLERLERALGSQRRFVADAAHELRSPLAALRIQMQLVERARHDGERNDALASLRPALDRATHMVEQLLILARQEPDVGERPRQPVRLDEVVRKVIADELPLAAARDIDLGMSATAPARVLGDADAIAIMVRNLVDNAIRYTPRGGRVDVSVMLRDAGAEVCVADTGPGIPAEERERVFDRFHRRPGSEAGGSGLGLAIARRIAEVHAASVTLSANPDGGGLLARVRFAAGGAG